MQQFSVQPFISDNTAGVYFQFLCFTSLESDIQIHIQTNLEVDMRI